MLDRHRLRDHTPQGNPDDVGLPEIERFKQAKRVQSHVTQGVGGLDRLPLQASLIKRGNVWNAGLLKTRRVACVAIVEPDHVEAAAPDQHIAEGVIPRDHLTSQAGDEEQRGGGAVAEGLIGNLETVRLGNFHFGAGRFAVHGCASAA